MASDRQSRGLVRVRTAVVDKGHRAPRQAVRADLRREPSLSKPGQNRLSDYNKPRLNQVIHNAANRWDACGSKRRISRLPWIKLMSLFMRSGPAAGFKPSRMRPCIARQDCRIRYCVQSRKWRPRQDAPPWRPQSLMFLDSLRNPCHTCGENLRGFKGNPSHVPQAPSSHLVGFS